MYCGKLQKMRGAANHEKHCRRLQAQKLQSQACSEEFQRREKLPEVHLGFEEYRASQVPPKRRHPTDEKPWAPFRTRLDFEVAEFSQDTMLNKNQIDTLISLIRRCAENIVDFTLHNQSDLNKQWDLASKKCTEFERFEVTVPYKTSPQTFEMYARPLWNWAMDIVQDPHLADFFCWDAEQRYIFDGVNWQRFYTEPWTAEAMWEIQSKLPKSIDNKLLPFILYADKAKLSSFGTQKGYPVVARLANVVISLRNGSDWGGSQIVGWLPVVEEDPLESSKPGYVNFKNALWHKAFYKLLESIVMASKTGVMTKCGDDVFRCLFPMILILASDYEEAQLINSISCVMALIRGLRALYPCPICYVKKDEQSELSKHADLRTSQGSKDTVMQGRELNRENREELLKSHGLRNVDNVFWNVAYSDPHQALSFEHLHSYSSGLFSSFPRWRNLNHFESVMSTAFNDGTKHEDISKMIVLTAHNVLERPVDLLLLQVCRSYQELSLYVTMKRQTTDRIHDGEEELKNFGRLLKLYIQKASRTPGLDEKSWEFPKIHAHKHVFDDIRRKGAARNFGTKIDEALHGSTRNTYLRQTNFKNVAPQILWSEHRTMVGKLIRDQINDLDGIRQREWEVPNEEEAKDDPPPDITEEKADNVALGSKLAPISFARLEQEMKADTAFHRLRIRFSDFFTNFLHTYEGQLPHGKRVNFHSTDEVVPYLYLTIFYQSLDDWSDEKDLLRCNPQFHGHARYDGAMVLTPTGHIFVRLIYIFKVSANDKTYPFALVQPMDAPEKALKLFRVRARQASEFILVRSIVRGAVLVPDSDPERKGDFFVMDVPEGDMFLRLRDIFRDRFNK
ncbi:hypothetical protein DFH08DRAFT_996074 [Mycena albidolilacea]|uniref:Uncharacterized protein n=1 Tax=Mycena albidolilacea TaxID=1033008 RepID=A0AAD6YYJ1_9AGAR|nr:hypothetical protein DFH08DRAFT_996074 [Mycena albidolilacea]